MQQSMQHCDHRLAQALTEWQALLGAGRVVTGTAASQRYGDSTSGVEREIPAALLAESADEVAHIVRIAGRHRVSLYPISTGHNWGYGAANPVRHGCVVLDLSRMNRISAFDQELGTIRVEPGVTQAQLHRFLDERGARYMVPVTGAGPSCSLVGNALERGYGITPHTDHFQAVTAVEAVLPNGERYRSALRDLGATETDGAFKWGIGPYVDGLFSQGNFGVVTRMTLLLEPVPEKITAFFFRLRQDQDLEAAVGAVRQTLSTLGANIGGINLMNARRVLSMVAPYPKAEAQAGAALPDELVARLARSHGVAAWSGVGAIYGTTAISAATGRHVRKMLKPHVSRLVFVSTRRVRYAQRLATLMPRPLARRFRPTLEALGSSLHIFSGRPAEVALRLAYWKTPERVSDTGILNPARDGCGLIWYAPLVPMRAEQVRAFVSMVKTVCAEYDIDPLITLTSLSPRCFDSTVPLLFRRDDAAETARARACYEALFRAGQARGFLPYRLGAQSMTMATRMETPYWRLVRDLKTAIDPHDIIAPGRYSPP